MTQRNDGGPAFPTEPNTQPGFYAHHGMSLRDYFAAKAMQAIATNLKGADGFMFERRAEWAYQQADAMLAARERT